MAMETIGRTHMHLQIYKVSKSCKIELMSCMVSKITFSTRFQKVFITEVGIALMDEDHKEALVDHEGGEDEGDEATECQVEDECL